MVAEQKSKTPKRVCVIGAGPCGLAVLNAFESARAKGEDIPEIVLFDKQDEVAGLWNYTWRTGVDRFGEQLHNSQYRYLWSNGPKECLELADYSFEEHFGKPIPSFPPRVVLRDYLLGRVKKNKLLEKFDVRMNHIVRNVKDLEDESFEVTYEDLNQRKISTEIFSQVIVAIGHFSVPHFPSYAGLESYPGHLLHAHDFRDAASYKDQKVVLVGASYSAEDIALQLHKYGVGEVIASYRTQAMGFKWPTNITERPCLTHIDGKTVHFSDNSTYEADAIIFCTGYQYYFPFLPQHLRFESPNIEYPNGLYKGTVLNENTNLMFMGMQDQWYTFTMFDAEAFYVRDVILGKIELPDKSKRDVDIKKWYDRCIAKTTAVEAIEFQRDFVGDLLTYTDYPKHDNDSIAELLKAWKIHKSENILTYREHCHKSPVTGTVGAPLYAPWVDAMDDTLEGFLKC
ncbi:trimethylamine monooxygenase-like [Clytia hemisphaerica]|uniref:Flavin-containing monooxygenase n=1 Tax=Clytia hemisphaerica TaxID=252671 RepID=A0A7M5XB53_9CNID